MSRLAIKDLTYAACKIIRFYTSPKAKIRFYTQRGLVSVSAQMDARLSWIGQRLAIRFYRNGKAMSEDDMT